MPCILKYVRCISKYVGHIFSLLLTPLKTACHASFGKPRITPPFLSVSAMFPRRPSGSVHVSCKIRLRSESFKPQWFLLQNMLTLQQPASRQRCRAASGSGHIYKRRLLDALFLTLRNFANFQVWSRTRQQ